MDPAMREYLMTAGRQCIEDGGERFVPVLIMENSEGMQVFLLTGDGHPFEQLLTVVPTIAAMQPISLSLTVDSYCFIGHVNDSAAWEAKRASYGYSLARMWNANEPGVSEALSILFVTKNNDWSIMMPYERMPDESVAWGETTETMGAMENHGRMVELLRVALGVPPQGTKL